MKRIIYTRPDGGLSVVTPAPRAALKKVLGPLTKKAYEAHVKERSIPDDAINPRDVDDADIPETKEFRNAWCDVTPESRIDIDCTKAKEIQLAKMREKREELFAPLDKQFMLALERGADTSSIVAKKNALRDVTEPLKDLDTAGKVNDEALLEEIRKLGALE